MKNYKTLNYSYNILMNYYISPYFPVNFFEIISKFKFLGGTNSFNKLKGKECTYAVSYFKNKIFGSNKCQISDELFQELKK